jgi:hypothetical protein
VHAGTHAHTCGPASAAVPNAQHTYGRLQSRNTLARQTSTRSLVGGKRLSTSAQYEHKVLRHLSAMMDKAEPSADGAQPGKNVASVTNEDLSVPPNLPGMGRRIMDCLNEHDPMPNFECCTANRMRISAAGSPMRMSAAGSPQSMDLDFPRTRQQRFYVSVPSSYIRTVVLPMD